MRIIVKENDKLLNYLLNNLTDLSHKKIKSFLTNEMINIKGRVITKYDYPVKKGDIIEIKNNILNKKDKLNIHILYEDNDIVVVDKPSGLLTIGTQKHEKNTLYNKVSEYVKRDNPKNKIFIVHRLDKETSGIVLFAKRENVKNAYQENWNELVKTRRYIAIVNGYLDKKEGTIHTWLAENKNKMVYSTKNKEIGKEAITEYKVKKENNNLSLVEVYIKTGRKNQIRVHLKELGNSILGDVKYGGNKANRLYLHNDKLVLRNPFNNKTLSFELSLPNEFNKIMK